MTGDRIKPASFLSPVTCRLSRSYEGYEREVRPKRLRRVAVAARAAAGSRLPRSVERREVEHDQFASARERSRAHEQHAGADAGPELLFDKRTLLFRRPAGLRVCARAARGA